MKTAVFSLHKFEKTFWKKANKGKHELLFFDTCLTQQTTPFAKGCKAVSLFVSDDAFAPVLDLLSSSRIKHILLCTVGFNNVDLKKAKELGIKVAGVPAYSPYAVGFNADIKPKILKIKDLNMRKEAFMYE